MKWSELKKEITSLTPEEKAELELMAAIAKIRKQKNITHEQWKRQCKVQTFRQFKCKEFGNESTKYSATKVQSY